MIFTERTVTIRSGASSIDEKVILYRGDKKIEIRFTIKDSKFKFQKAGNIISNTNAAYAQLAILNPNGGNTFTEITPTDNGTVLFEISGEMIDELEEVGLYSFHIRLFDEGNESRITLPPVIDGIEIREPVIMEADPVVGAVNEDNIITIYDMLEPGIYTLKYEFKDGTQEELEEFTVREDSNTISTEVSN